MRALTPKVLRDAKEIILAYADLAPMDAGRAQRVASEINRCLTPKRSKAPARKRRATKKATRKEKTAAIRAAVFARAGGRCEHCGTDGTTALGPLEMDHARGGSQKRSHESVQGCWMLCRTDHAAKTANAEGRMYWLAAFRGHCLRHNYFREARETERLMDVCGTKAELSKAVGR